MEIVFSMVQANKLLKHMYTHYNALIQEHKHDVNMNMMRDLYYNEDTNIYSHYVLKIVHLFFIKQKY